MCIDGIPVPIYQDQGELWQLREMVRDLKPARILEIGSLFGGTLYCWMQDAPGSLVVSVDTGVQSFDYRHDQVEAARGLWQGWAKEAGCQLVEIRRNSTHPETIREVLGHSKFDFIFVDGGHDYETAMHDFENYWGMLRKGGLMAFHDIAYPDNNPDNYAVGRVWREVKEVGKEAIEIIRPNNVEGIWGIGVLRKW